MTSVASLVITVFLGVQISRIFDCHVAIFERPKAQQDWSRRVYSSVEPSIHIRSGAPSSV